MTLGDAANKFLVKIIYNQALGWTVTFGTDITAWD
jgi:hypothetical protein